jgi:2Fe-2S ferredoxin
MPTVTYISPDETEYQINVPVGMTLMHGALLNNVPGLLAECGGAMICATCHCYIDTDWLNKVDIASAGEREKLAKVHAPRPNSRLSCQVRVTDELDGIRVRLPETQVWSS